MTKSNGQLALPVIDGVIKYITDECFCHGLGELGVQRMWEAWRYANYQRNAPLTLTRVKNLAKRMEPNKNEHYRSDNSPSVLAKVLPYEEIPEAIKALIDSDPEGIATIEQANEWLRKFLFIHPFAYGNWQIGSLLHNWMCGTLLTPVAPANFYDTSGFADFQETRIRLAAGASAYGE